MCRYMYACMCLPGLLHTGMHVSLIRVVCWVYVCMFDLLVVFLYVRIAVSACLYLL